MAEDGLSGEWVVLIEFFLIFGVVLGLAVYSLVKTNRELAQTRAEREARETQHNSSDQS